MLSPHDLVFQLIKSKKHYKTKFSTNLILKKKPTKIILEGKKIYEEKHNFEKKIDKYNFKK